MELVKVVCGHHLVDMGVGLRDPDQGRREDGPHEARGDSGQENDGSGPAGHDSQKPERLDEADASQKTEQQTGVNEQDAH